MVVSGQGGSDLVTRVDGTYSKSGDWTTLNYGQTNLIGGAPTTMAEASAMMALVRPDGSRKLHLTGADAAELQIDGASFGLSRTTTGEIAADLSPEEKAFVEESNKPHVLQGGKWTVTKMSQDDSAPVQDSTTSTPTVVTPAPTPSTDAAPTNDQPVDISTSKTPPQDNGDQGGQSGQASDSSPSGNPPSDNPPAATDQNGGTGATSGTTTG